MARRVVVTFQNSVVDVSPALGDLRLSAADEIIWELDTVNSAPGVHWPSAGGIEFTSSWTIAGNHQPVLNTTTNEYHVNDNGPFDATRTFQYTVTILSEGNTTHHRADPDVTNTPPAP